MNFDFDVESLSPNASTVITLSSTGAVQLPAGTTAQQPTATAGRLRWNSDTTRLEYANGSIWQNIQFSSTTLAGYGITDAQPLNVNLTAYAGLATTGLVIRTGAGTAVTRSIAGTAGNITVGNGDGVAGNPTINLATAGTAGTYAQVTTDAFGRVTSGVATQTVATGGTGLTALGTANQVLGVNAGASALEYKTLTAGTNISIVHAANSVTINATGGGTPGGVNTNVQYNNSGAFGGSNAFNFVNGTNPYVSIQGTNEQNMLRVGGSASLGNAHFYIEVNSAGGEVEAQRVYFNRNAASINGWISYDYDGNTPHLRLTDEDDDPPYIQFNTIGTGTYTAPLYSSAFGARGAPGSRTGGNNQGFAWLIRANGDGNDAYANYATDAVMELDRYWLRLPVGSTAQRPTGVDGMVRYNTDFRAVEYRQPNVWVRSSGVIEKDVTTVALTGTGENDLVNFTVPGGTLGTDGIIRITISGTFANGNNGTRSLTFRVRYGATLLFQDTTPNQSTNTTSGFTCNLYFAANDSVNAQSVSGFIMVGGTGASASGITGDLSSDEILANAQITATSSVNSASDQTLRVTVQASGSGVTVNRYFELLELL